MSDKSKRPKLPRFTVTLRRDVQQIIEVNVEATNQHDAIATAEAIADDSLWSVEECIGTHRPRARRIP
jgi:hypothetical protein